MATLFSSAANTKKLIRNYVRGSLGTAAGAGMLDRVSFEPNANQIGSEIEIPIYTTPASNTVDGSQHSKSVGTGNLVTMTASDNHIPLGFSGSEKQSLEEEMAEFERLSEDEIANMEGTLSQNGFPNVSGLAAAIKDRILTDALTDLENVLNGTSNDTQAATTDELTYKEFIERQTQAMTGWGTTFDQITAWLKPLVLDDLLDDAGDKFQPSDLGFGEVAQVRGTPVFSVADSSVAFQQISATDVLGYWFARGAVAGGLGNIDITIKLDEHNTDTGTYDISTTYSFAFGLIEGSGSPGVRAIRN